MILQDAQDNPGTLIQNPFKVYPGHSWKEMPLLCLPGGSLPPSRCRGFVAFVLHLLLMAGLPIASRSLSCGQALQQNRIRVKVCGATLIYTFCYWLRNILEVRKYKPFTNQPTSGAGLITDHRSETQVPERMNLQVPKKINVNRKEEKITGHMPLLSVDFAVSSTSHYLETQC